MAHCGQAAHAQFLRLRMIDHLALEAGITSQLLGLCCNPRWIADIRRRCSNRSRVIHCAAKKKTASNAIGEVWIGGLDDKCTTTLRFARCSAIKVINAPIGHGKTFGKRPAEGFHIGTVLWESCREIHADGFVLASIQDTDQLRCSNADGGGGEQGGVAESQQHMLGSGGKHFAIVSSEARGLKRVCHSLHLCMSGRHRFPVRGNPHDNDGRAG